MVRPKRKSKAGANGEIPVVHRSGRTPPAPPPSSKKATKAKKKMMTMQMSPPSKKAFKRSNSWIPEAEAAAASSSSFSPKKKNKKRSLADFLAVPPPAAASGKKHKKKALASLGKQKGKEPPRSSKRELAMAAAKAAEASFPPPPRKKAKKAPTFQIDMPPQRSTPGRIPWMTKSAAAATTPEERPTANVLKRGGRLPTDEFDPALLDQFSQELQRFADYIRLTPAECEARNALLDQMHRVAVRVFGNSPEINVNDLELQVFGSFACQEVCSFRSDIDVALWGVVFPKLTHLKKVSTSTTSVEEHQVVLLDPKKERVQKWKAALLAATGEIDNGAVSTNIKNDDEKDPNISSAPRTTKEAADVTLKKNESKGDALDVKNGDAEEKTPLFVLDYTGDDVQEVQEKSKVVAAASVSTQATAVESESTSTEDDGDAVIVVEQSKLVDVDDDDVFADASDDDTADKLSEPIKAPVPEAAAPPPEAQQNRDNSMTNEAEASRSGGEMAVHFFHRKMPNIQTDSSDFSRRKVVDALQRFFRGLRNSGLSRSIQLISKARVPIIKMEAILGVEIDCSIGGMNGADTRLYALKMSQTYKSFSPVVLAMKVIMGQQKLDTPFSGGLGSYKLYVLVATHIAKHVALGGRDDPGEIFLSFAYRYGNSLGSYNCHHASRTMLEKDDIVTCNHGGEADLSNVFLIGQCRSLFGTIWDRLKALLRANRNNPSGEHKQPASYLVEVVHTTWLDHSRQTNIRNAELFLKERGQRPVGQVPRKSHPGERHQPVKSAARRQRDLTEEELVASYNGRDAKRARR